MFTTSKPFLALTAGDLMSREVVTVPHNMSLRAAAHLLSESAISGAPVVDAAGRCVGVLSATDFIHWAETDQPPVRSRPCSSDSVCSDWQMVVVEELPTDAVSNFMTVDPVTVAPSTAIGELARRMLDAHIHRLIVVDRDHQPVGVVSSTDVLAAVAYVDHRTS